MKPDVLSAEDFDLALTLESGQVFHWVPDGDAWVGLAGDIPVRARQSGDRLEVTRGTGDAAARYFALDHALPAIYAHFPADPYTRDALAACHGMRLIRQPKWECLATFITSSMKQVAHIRQMSAAIRTKFGEPVGGWPVRRYPTPERLASASESDLRKCGLGYRAKNLLAAARMVAAGEIDLEAGTALDSPTLLAELVRVPGVGKKVANCVMLFAYERLDAVPIDVWIGRILRAMRGGRRRATDKELERFSRERLGGYAGYVQQYLFHHARVTGTLPSAR